MKRRCLVAAVAAASLLAACGQHSSSSSQAQAPAAAAPASQPVSLDAIAAEAKGFSVGSMMSAHTAYVFFDPQCPHCGRLWESAKPLKAYAHFVWVPVALLNDKSGPEGAAILASADPVAAMDQHEASMRAGQGGIDVAGATAAMKDAVKHNTELMNRYGFMGVPEIVAKGANGQVIQLEGEMSTAMLAQKLGLGGTGS
jgi:thiol:disulfide interchange protein DsbG